MIFKNIVISPNKFDGHNSGPVIDYGPFRLCRGGEVIDHPHNDIPVISYIDCAVWGGFIHNHFGHFIPEHTTRLVHNEPLPVIFVNYFDVIPHMFYDICELFNITPIICSSPTKVKYLTIRPQMEQYTLPQKLIFPSDRYLQMLHGIRHNYSPHKKIFVSRGKVNIGMAGIAGERIIIKAFESAGYHIMYPDDLSLIEQLAVYNGATDIVMIEGSAVYALQLLGKIGRVTIITRRPKFKMNWQSLIKRATALRYIDAVIHIDSLEKCSRRNIATINPEILNRTFDLNIDQKLYYAYAKSDIELWRISDIKLPPCPKTMCKFIGCQ